MYHTLEPHKLTASERLSDKPHAKHHPTQNPTHLADTAQGSRGEERGAILNPDNRTDLKAATTHPRDRQNFTFVYTMHRSIEEETEGERKVAAGQGRSIGAESGGGRSKEDLRSVDEGRSSGDEGGGGEGDKGTDHRYDQVLINGNTRDNPNEQHGYDELEENCKGSNSSEIPHGYDVLEDNRNPSKMPHDYHVLEEKKTNSTSSRSNRRVTMIPSRPNPRDGRDTDSSDQFKKGQSFHHSRHRDLSRADLARVNEGRVFSKPPLMSAPPPPTRRTTYSSAPSPEVRITGQEKVFDDPKYATAFNPPPLSTGSGGGGGGGSGDGGDSSPHNRSRSLRHPQKVQNSYELASNFGTNMCTSTSTTTGAGVAGDPPEMETTNMGAQATTASLPTLFDDPGYGVGLNLKKGGK